jgi:hypothetical protein
MSSNVNTPSNGFSGGGNPFVVYSSVIVLKCFMSGSSTLTIYINEFKFPFSTHSLPEIDIDYSHIRLPIGNRQWIFIETIVCSYFFYFPNYFDLSNRQILHIHWWQFLWRIQSLTLILAPCRCIFPNTQTFHSFPVLL